MIKVRVLGEKDYTVFVKDFKELADYFWILFEDEFHEGRLYVDDDDIFSHALKTHSWKEFENSQTSPAPRDAESS